METARKSYLKNEIIGSVYHIVIIKDDDLTT